MQTAGMGTETESLDEEWIQLLKLARAMGITPEQVRDFFIIQNTKLMKGEPYE